MEGERCMNCTAANHQGALQMVAELSHPSGGLVKIWIQPHHKPPEFKLTPDLPESSVHTE